MSAVSVLVRRAAESARSLTAEQFAAAMHDPDAVVVDVREADERTAWGSIARAVHVPRGMLEFRADATCHEHDPRLQVDVPVLVYCSDGARSMLAATALRGLGYSDVRVLERGFIGWAMAGMPVVGRVVSPY